MKKEVKNIICFDASVRDNIVGIGIHDTKKEVKINKRFSTPREMTSCQAETMALIATLQYIQEINTKPTIYHIFSDNMNVVRNGISNHLIEKYCQGFQVFLHWLPREFNTIADKLSKDGSAVSEITLNQNSQIKNLIKVISKYPLKNKIDMLKKISKTPEQLKFVQFINGETAYKKMKGPAHKIFKSIVLSIIKHGECKRLDKVFSNRVTLISDAEFKKFIS